MFSYLFLFIFPFILFSYFFPFFTSTIMLICIFFYINASHMLRNKVNSIHKSFFTCFYLISKYLLACIEIDILHCHTYLQVLFIHLLYGGSKKKVLVLSLWILHSGFLIWICISSEIFKTISDIFCNLWR